MRIFLFLVVLTIARIAPAAETVRYIALSGDGKPGGQQVVTRGDDGVTRVTFVYKDNGRGPDLTEEFVLARDGTFDRYQVKGTSTFGAPVEEMYLRDGTAGRWRSKADEGTTAGRSAAGAQYYPLSGTPASLGATVAALAARADARLPLLPSGTLTRRIATDIDVTRAQTAPRKVQLLALTGVGLTPTFVWMTQDATPRLFALIYPGFLRVIEDGWEANVAALETAQKQAEADALVALQRRVAHPLPGTTVIRSARVFDSEKAALGANSDVVLRDGRILAVVPAGSGPADAASTVEAGGRVLLPGLFDMHAHFSRWDGGLHLAAGVTTIRDMGNDNTILQQLMAEERAGTLLAPRIVPAGFIEGESPMSARNGFVISDLTGAKRAVDWYAANGYPQVKIYNSFPRQILRETVAYAHAKGMRVSGHVPVYMRAEEVVQAGYDEIQHINQVMLNFFVRRETDTRTLERFYLVAERTAALDFDSKPVRDFIALLVRRQIVIDPTLATFDFLRQRAGELSQAFAAVAPNLPPDVQRALRIAEFNIPDAATAAKYTTSYDKMVEFVGRLYRAGVPIVAGTDGPAGFTLQRELELYVQAGMTPPQALQIATWTGARYARVLDERGSVTTGKLADVVLVDGDPTVNIGDLRRVTLVIKGSVAYYPSEIYESLGVQPFAEPVRVQQPVTR